MNIRSSLLLVFAGITFSSFSTIYLPAGYDKDECVSDPDRHGLQCCDQNNSNCIFIPLCPAFGEQQPQKRNRADDLLYALEPIVAPIFNAIESKAVPMAALRSALEIVSNPEVFFTAILQEDSTNPALACSVTRDFLVAAQSLSRQQFYDNPAFPAIIQSMVADFAAKSAN